MDQTDQIKSRAFKCASEIVEHLKDSKTYKKIMLYINGFHAEKLFLLSTL